MAEVKKLGDMLKEAGLIDDSELQSALTHQRTWGGKLGAILIEMDFVKEEELAKVIAEKLRIPYVNLFEPEVSEAVIKLIRPEIAKKYHVMPARKEGGALILAMMDPLDIEAIDAIRFATGFNIKPSLALESEIRDAIRKYYDGEKVVRTKSQRSFYQRSSSSEKLEIISGNDLTLLKEVAPEGSSPTLSKGDTTQPSREGNETRLDALITLLVNKGLITREELAGMVSQKKTGH
jgi:type IV pilus assembly protein PilB